MNEWWEALTVLQKVLYCIAIPATLILLIQTVLVIVGFGDGGTDINPSDVSGLDLPDTGTGLDLPDSIPDADITVSGDFSDLKLFTVQGAVAFLASFSWTAIVCVNAKLHPVLSIFIGILCGTVMMYLVAKILQLTTKLAENGSFRLKSVIGETAQVYVPIQPKGENGGKVTLTSASRFNELFAVTEEEETIPTGSQVRIVDVRGDMVVVERTN